MPEHGPPPRHRERASRPPSSQFGTTTIFDHVSPAVASAPALLSPFDACHVGVVLRAVLFVHGVLAVGVLFAAEGWDGWLLAFAYASAVALPGTLAWLLLACLLKRPLASVGDAWQWAAAVALGATCAAFGQWQVGLLVPAQPGAGVVSVSVLAAGASLAAAMFYALRLRARSQLPAATTARLAELQSRIRPHFLFNTLNTAMALVRIDPGRAEQVLEDLSELFRVALIESGHTVTLAEEIELARRYLDIEQIRFGARLKVHWDLDEGAGGARVPPLVLQPLVENAVRHGVEPAPQGGWVRIRMRRRRGQALVSVTNSLPPAAQPGQSRGGHGIALRNVKERLRLMHDVTADFAAGPEGDTWRVQIAVPLA